jgi:taurine--2-oxoglutarate transaminase
LACVACLRAAIEAEGPDTIAAFIAEPITGTSGVIVPPPGYYEAVRAICDEYGILWIADEVLTGFGRTGTMFAFQHWDAVPDIITLAKGLTASYLPLGAAVFNSWVSSAFEAVPFPQGHTYAGHPVSCAASLEVLSIYEDIDIVHNAARLGGLLAQKLPQIATSSSLIQEVRGIGCLWALDYSTDGKDAGISAAQAACDACRKNGVLLLRREAMLIVAPPLIMSISELSDALDDLQAAIEEM